MRTHPRRAVKDRSAEIALSVVVPVYNSAATLETLVESLLAELGAIAPSFEIVMVEDGSSDDSWVKLVELRQRAVEKIAIVRLMRNFGQHNALMCGFSRARGKYVVTMDDDLQNPPSEIRKLYDAIQRQSLDVVYGRYVEKQHRRWRNLGSRLVDFFYRIVFRQKITTSSFRIVRREVLQGILSYDLNYTYIDGLLAWSTERISECAVIHQPRQAGYSGYSIGKLLVLALNMFTNFSLMPLQFVSVVGLITAATGFALGAYYVLQFLFSSISVPGYASTITAILVLGGVQLVALGIMGEYLGRLHLNVNRKPQYVVRESQTPDDRLEQ